MDRIIRATAAGDFIKMAVIDARDTVEEARRIHGCAPTAAAAFGRTLCGASLLGQAMKEENASLTIRVNGGGPAGSIVAVSDHEGYVRGYIENPDTDLPLRSDGHLNVGGAVGRDGMITVLKDIGLKEPYVGSAELVSGEIAEDLTAYLLQSEQIPSACGLGVLIDTDRTVKAAGGFVVQLMPFADEKYIDMLEENIFMMDQLTTILDEDGAEEVFRQVLKGIEYHVVGEYPVGYRCSCSREKIRDALVSIGQSELENIISEDKGLTANCRFCGRDYSFSEDELRALLK